MNNEINITDKERAQAEKIRRQYINRDQDKLELLRRLDGKVKMPGRIAGSLMGVVGTLIMGGCMSLIMVWGNMEKGLILGVPGMILALLAYPTYSLITSRRKKKYAEEIFILSEEVK